MINFDQDVNKVMEEKDKRKEAVTGWGTTPLFGQGASQHFFCMPDPVY